MGIERRFRWFRQDVCDRCGDCFRTCPVLNLTPEAAKADIEALITGETAKSAAFRNCTTCNICDLTCTRGADPYELILERFGDYQQHHGLPLLAKLIFPNEPDNLWSGLRVLMADGEISLLRTWEAKLQQPQRQILLTGFYTNIVPYLTGAGILDELRPFIAGSAGLWGCGGDSTKLGMAPLTGQIVELLERQFARMGVERVYCFMEAEAAMLADVLPQRFGARFQFEALPLDYWVLDRLKAVPAGQLEKVGMKVTVHDNCMSRYLGGHPQQVIREIVDMCGCNTVEMKHHHCNALCCGWAATIPTLYGKGSDNPLGTLVHLLRSLQRRLLEARETGADAIVASCPACYIFLNLIKELTAAPIAVYHPLEIVQLSTGRKTFQAETTRRTWDVLAVASSLVMKWFISKQDRQRFFPGPVDAKEVSSLPQATEEDSRRIRAFRRVYSSALVRNRLSRGVIGAAARRAARPRRSLR